MPDALGKTWSNPKEGQQWRETTTRFAARFAAKSQDEVENLIAGPLIPGPTDVFICNECVMVCHDFLQERRAEKERQRQVERVQEEEASRVTPSPPNSRLHAVLKAQLGDDLYGSWFSRLQIEALEGTVLTASVPTLFIQRWIERHYYNALLKACRSAQLNVERVHLTQPARRPIIPR